MASRQNVLNVLLFIFLGMAQVVSNYAIPHFDTPWSAPDVSVERKFDPVLFRSLTFGHVTAGIDWLLIRFLANSGQGKVAAGTHPSFYYDLDLASDLDPAFFELYSGGADLLSVLRGDYVGAKALLLKGDAFVRNELPSYGIKFQDHYWSRTWNLYVDLAYANLFGLGDMPSAAAAFRQGALYPGAPEYLLLLEKRLKRPGGEYEVGLRLLNFYIEQKADDQPARTKLEKQRLDLFVAQYIYETNHTFQEFLNTQPGYRAHERLSEVQMTKYWKDFRRTTQTPEKDPWGGRMHLDSVGNVVSSTPHDPVFGLR
jgi:hypothetical protein